MCQPGLGEGAELSLSAHTAGRSTVLLSLQGSPACTAQAAQAAAVQGQQRGCTDPAGSAAAWAVPPSAAVGAGVSTQQPPLLQLLELFPRCVFKAFSPQGPRLCVLTTQSRTALLLQGCRSCCGDSQGAG